MQSVESWVTAPCQVRADKGTNLGTSDVFPPLGGVYQMFPSLFIFYVKIMFLIIVNVSPFLV